MLQVVECIQEYESHSGRLGLDNGMFFLNDPAADKHLLFLYGQKAQTYTIRIAERKGHFAVFIDEHFSAQLEMLGEWVVTSGEIPDPDLLAELIRRLDAHRIK